MALAGREGSIFGSCGHYRPCGIGVFKSIFAVCIDRSDTDDIAGAKRAGILCKIYFQDDLALQTVFFLSISRGLAVMANNWGGDFTSGHQRLYGALLPGDAVFVDRLAVVFGNAGSGDWHCAGRSLAGDGGSVDLCADDWVVFNNGMGPGRACGKETSGADEAGRRCDCLGSYFDVCNLESGTDLER